MRKLFLFFTLVTILISLASAEIIITSPTNEIYNLGETITIPLTIRSLSTLYANLELNLICGGKEINFYKNGISLSGGQEKKIDASLILTKEIINDSKGKCIIKAILGDQYKVTTEFTISDTIQIIPETDKKTLDPGQAIIISGSSNKLSKKPVNGFIDMTIYLKNKQTNESNITTLTQTINKGFFSLNYTTNEEMPAGTYVAQLHAYEKDLLGKITNQGKAIVEFTINQIPTNLEIATQNLKIIPKEELKTKIILHDQTGVNIDTPAQIKIFDADDKLIEQKQIKTNQEFTYPTEYNTKPGQYKIVAESSGIENQQIFLVEEKQNVELRIINKTLLIKNIGNVPYCDKTILVKIGNQALNIAPCIEVDEEKKYQLSAPDGDYDVEIVSDEAQYKESVTLTGKSIDVKEAQKGAITLTRIPFIWIFVFAIMGFVAFTVFKKGVKKTFIGYKKNTPKNKPKAIKKAEYKTTNENLFNANAELLLSIKGEKQNSAILNLKIKNLSEVLRNKIGVQETISRIAKIIREQKGAIYENQENIFIILAPTKTKTFQNEKTAFDIAQKIKTTLDRHNKLFKQKIEYGISINSGPIIAKQGPEKMQFASLGTLLNESKKIASISNETILLGEKAKEKLGKDIKFKKFSKGDFSVYTIEEIKNKKEHEKFIKSFIERLEKK